MDQVVRSDCQAVHSYRRRSQRLFSLGGCWLVLRRPQNRYADVRDLHRSVGHRDEVGVGFGVGTGFATGAALEGQGAQHSEGPS